MPDSFRLINRWRRSRGYRGVLPAVLGGVLVRSLASRLAKYVAAHNMTGGDESP
jgi:hypothetical protein